MFCAFDNEVSAGYNCEHELSLSKNTPLEIKTAGGYTEKKTYSKAQLEAALKERCWSTLDDINRIQKDYSKHIRNNLW